MEPNSAKSKTRPPPATTNLAKDDRARNLWYNRFQPRQLAVAVGGVSRPFGAANTGGRRLLLGYSAAYIAP